LPGGVGAGGPDIDHAGLAVRALLEEELAAALPPLDAAAYDLGLAGSPHRLGDYAVGELSTACPAASVPVDRT
jgi:hypothetical protein